MRLVTFASGSSGNCALVREGDTSLLIDAGISMKRIRAALARQGLDFGGVDAILITHEHADHVCALRMLCRHTSIPIYAPRTVGARLLGMAPEIQDLLRVLPLGEPVPMKNMAVTAFLTSHDTDQSVGYILEGSGRLGFCTDTGCVTGDMLAALRGCTAALIEANHDPDMLRWGRYPVALKRRILSDRGHLSNQAGGALACELSAAGASAIVLGHLSRENNTPRLAHDAVRAALDAAGWTGTELFVAPADGDLELEVRPCCASV